ncbi:hypothetical protein OQA88_4432 [Cercophora sp. LCS_1]
MHSATLITVVALFTGIYGLYVDKPLEKGSQPGDPHIDPWNDESYWTIGAGKPPASPSFDPIWWPSEPKKTAAAKSCDKYYPPPDGSDISVKPGSGVNCQTLCWNYAPYKWGEGGQFGGSAEGPKEP